MHPATVLSVPVFYAQQVKREAEPVTYMFRVEIRVMGRVDGHTWQGWAADASDAGRRAIDDARQRWRGYSFVIRSTVQVNA